ncbi:phytanoyl-CoA dioxygenase [Flammeovirgaceae bacterium 311]|nr:phytanoyl-CoA dioxygenase [Flammeovirgaceae bacterium 311]
MDTLQLPALDDYRLISEAQKKEFRSNGHTLTPNLLNPEEAALYRDVILEAATKYNTEKRRLEERDTYGKAFLQIMDLYKMDDKVRKFTLAKRFAKVAAELLGVKNVRIYHDQALYKEPGGGITPWHQDQYYWPLDTNNTITMWMPLIDISEEMGMLTFASGSHLDGFVENLEISDESEQILQNYVKSRGFDIVRPKSMKAGDATWHYGWTLHSAPGNQSKETTREVMTVIYFADGARVTEPQNKWQENDRLTHLCGTEVGKLAASKANPLVL